MRILSCKIKKDKEYRAHLKKFHVRAKDAKTKGLLNQPKALQCELCDYRHYSRGIIFHMRDFHRVTENLKKDKECLACFLANEPLSIFSSYEAVRLHIIQKHEESAIYFCHLCDTNILSVKVFIMHLKNDHRIDTKRCTIRKLENGYFTFKDKDPYVYYILNS